MPEKRREREKEKERKGKRERERKETERERERERPCRPDRSALAVCSIARAEMVREKVSHRVRVGARKEKEER